MNNQLDHAIRSVTADIVAVTPPREAGPVHKVTKQSSHSSRRWIAAAAGLLLFAGVAGLLAIGNRDSTSEPASVPTLEPDEADPVPTLERDEPDTVEINRGLGAELEIDPDEWVVPSDLSKTGQLQYAAIEPGPGVRTVHYGPIGEPATLDITIDTFSTDSNGTPVDVNGIEWKETDEPGFWNAERRIGDADIRVSSGKLDVEQGRQILSGLTVIASEELQSEPMDSNVLLDDQTSPVATYTTDDQTFTMRAAQQNGYYCTFTNDGTGGGGGGCGQLFDPATSWASPGIAGIGHEDNTNVVTVEASGIVATDVATIEIDFINDTTVTVTPTDLIGTFPVRFWIAGATIDLEPGQDPTRINSGFVQVRGLDDDANVLYTQNAASGTANR